jgi:HD domain
MTTSALHAREQSTVAGLMFAAAATLVTVSIAITADRQLVNTGVALAFAAFVAVGEFVRVTLPSERESAPLGAAGALAYALLPSIGDHRATHGVMQVIAVVACGMAAGLLPHAVAGRGPRLDYLARRILVVAVAAALFRPLYVGENASMADSGVGLATFMILVVVVAAIVDALLAAGVRTSTEGTPLWAAFTNEVHAMAGITSAIGATGVLVAVATGVMGLWAIPILSAPLLLAQFSFRRYSAIRATYLQTIRSLSRVTELGGYTEPGHSERVSRLAVAVGRELGMSDQDLLELEYAALMHDIGQLSLPEPIPGGATVLLDSARQREIAELGAAVIRQATVLDPVADIVERQSEPYRGADRLPDRSLPLASRIIRAVNAYDDMASGTPDPSRRAHAINRLRLSSLREFDPAVVDSLSRIVERTRL